MNFFGVMQIGHKVNNRQKTAFKNNLKKSQIQTASSNKSHQEERKKSTELETMKMATVEPTVVKMNGTFRKTTSSESLKTTTIVTPIELEANDESGERMRAELSIIKLESEAANILTLDARNAVSSAVGEEETNGAGEKEKRSSKVFMFSSELTDVEQISADDREGLELVANDLFDWLLWIEHTLETQLVAVGDLDQIEQLIKKYDVISNSSLSTHIND